ncbi:signal peptidase I [Leptospira wolffii]|uniref:signal peptidase I n=1 Tax=Leptospira wolffii TaxID=409998 RepID=UPI0002DC7287|nr:signal peptidase I [Leptospira wolffii]EPG64216.1 signal peptidase I [Leptospira wolffii serovar Khorat str. Khorat-H2]
MIVKSNIFLFSIYLFCGFTFCNFPVALAKEYAFTPSNVKSGGMEPSLQIGDFIFVKKFDLNPERGDILTFKAGIKEDGSERNNVQRVIGLPGDKISLWTEKSSQGDYFLLRISINGKTLPITESSEEINQEDYDIPVNGLHAVYETIGAKKYKLFYDTSMIPFTSPHAMEKEEINLKEDEFFLLGDNRTNSADSRYTGPISRADIRGKMTFKYFSVNWKDYTCTSEERKGNLEDTHGGKCPQSLFRRIGRAKIRWKNIGQKGYEILQDRQSEDL